MADDLGSDGEFVVTGKRRAEIGFKHPVVTLKVGGQLFRTWKSQDIQRSIETIAGGFTLGMSDVDPAAGTLAKVAPGAACEVDVDGEPLITGWIDESGPEYDADNHELRISGRDKTGDLVDSAAYVPGNAIGVWAKGQPVLQVVSQICDKFGIKVTQEVDAGKVGIFTLHMGEEAFTAIDRICKEAGVLPVSDGLGGIVLTQGGLGSKFADLVEGKNILAAKGGVNWRQRFSHYYVFADQAGIYVTEKTDAHMGLATDPEVKRWRPKFIVTDVRKPLPLDLNQIATWYMTVAAAKSYRHVVVAAGWRDSSGLLWQPNGKVKVTSKKLGCDEELLVVSTRHLTDDDGSRCELGVTRPDAFKLMPLDAGDDYIIPGSNN